MKPALLFTMLAALAIAVPVGADGCVCACDPPLLTTPGTGVSITGQGSEGRYYVDNELCQLDGCLFSVWIYEETNGIAGLQRGDEVHDDTCGGAIAPDTPVLL